MNLFFELFNFLSTADKYFSIREFLESIQFPVTSDISKSLYDALIFYDIAYLHSKQKDSELSELKWITKEQFFNKKEFVVAPTEFEIEQGILILGTRFTWAGAIYGAANQTILTLGSEVLSYETTEIHNEFVSTYYFLFNENMVMNELCTEYEQNISRITNFAPNTFVYVTSINIRNLYERLNFTVGDRLLFRIKDFSKNIIEILPKKAPKINANDAQNWKTCFTESVTNSCKILGPEVNPLSILEFAFFLGQDTLFSKKNIAIEEAFFENKEIKNMDYGFKSIIWSVSLPIPIRKDWAVIIDVKSNKINDFFYNIETPISKDILKIIIDDFLANNYLQSNIEDEINTFCKNLALAITPKKIKSSQEHNLNKVNNIILKLYKKAQEKYNRFSENDELIAFRSKVVQLFLDVVMLVHNLAEKKLSPQSFKHQSGLMLDQMLIQASDFIQSVPTIYTHKHNIENYTISLNNTIDMYESVKVEIHNQINNNFMED